METDYFYGVDKSIDISILEYGVLVSKEPDHDNNYLILYGINHDGNRYEAFCSIILSEEEVNDKINESWFNKESFLSTCGQTEQEWLSLNIANKMRDMIAYHNHENICGISYASINEDELRQFLSEHKN